MSRPTPYQLKILKDICERQSGWSEAGILVSKNIGHRLVGKDLCRWAPPFWPIHLMKNSERLVSVAPTTIGRLYAEDKIS